METLKNTNPTDPNYIILAQKQKDIKDNLKTAEDSLYALSRRVPQIQSTVNQEIASINNHIDQSLENLSDRRTPEATRNQQYAMTSMNNLALMLSEALEQLQNSMKNGKSGKGKGKTAIFVATEQNAAAAEPEYAEDARADAEAGKYVAKPAKRDERTVGKNGPAAANDKASAAGN